VFADQTYDFDYVASVVHGIRPELDLIYKDGDSLTTQSDFVSLMHTLDLAVHPFFLIGDQD